MKLYKLKKVKYLKNTHFLYSIFLIILIFTFIGSVSAIESDTTLSKTNMSDNIISMDSDSAFLYEDILTSKSIEDIDENDEDHELDLESENFRFCNGLSDNVEKDKLSDSSAYTISSSLSNDEIQAIFDGLKSGDTVEFVDKNYNNISIVVDKKVNIISTKNSVINTVDSISAIASQMGIESSFGFYLTSAASGSLIKGLTFSGNADYPILVEGADSVVIKNNTIKFGNKAGIFIENSKKTTIMNNTILNAYDGIFINNVNNTKISFNNIYSNSHDGIVVCNAAFNDINNNTIKSNDLDGLHLENATSNNILGNKIIDNGVSGLRTEGFTTSNIISYNNISSNAINIYIDSTSKNDNITYNTLMYAKAKFNAYTPYDNTGSGIFFGDHFSSGKKVKISFAYNSIGFNDLWDAKTDMANPSIEIGPNWYFDNDGEYARGHICPMIFGNALSASNFKYLSMGFSQDGDGIFGQLFNGEKASGAGAFTIDNVNINGKDYGSYTVGTDGKFKLDLDSLPAGSEVQITINGHTFTVKIDNDVVANKNQSQEDNADNANDDNNPKQETKENLGEGKDSEIVGNGTGSGTGSMNGIGSGEGNFTGSGISVGDVSGESNLGTGDSGENGGGSASKGVNAYEILQQEPNPVVAKNSQVLALFAVFFVLFVIVLGYRSKNKDDENNFEL